MPFTAKLLMISPALFFFLINIVFIGISILLLLIVRQSCPYQTRQRHNDVASSIFNRAGAIYGIMLAFVVIVLWQQYNKAVDNATREGAEAFQLYRDLSLYPDQQQVDQAIKSLVDFARLVVEDEYPAMRQMKMSQATEQAMSSLVTDTLKIKPQNHQEEVFYNKILKDLEQLAKLRHERLMEMESNLPNIIWIALIVGAIVTMLFSVFFGAEKLWIHMVLASLFAIILATTFFLIIELDCPFMGELSAKPDNYIKMLKMVGKK